MFERKDPLMSQGKDDDSLARLLQDITAPTAKPGSGLGADSLRGEAPRPALNSMRPLATSLDRGGAASSGTSTWPTIASAPLPPSREAQARPVASAGADTAS